MVRMFALLGIIFLRGSANVPVFTLHYSLRTIPTCSHLLLASFASSSAFKLFCMRFVERSKEAQISEAIRTHKKPQGRLVT